MAVIGAHALTDAAIVIGTRVLVLPGAEWFLPFFYLELPVGHALHEEPYRAEAHPRVTPRVTPTGETLGPHA